MKKQKFIEDSKKKKRFTEVDTVSLATFTIVELEKRIGV